MTKVIEAIYEDGVLKPVEALDLAERQRVRITVRPIVGGSAEAAVGRVHESPEIEEERERAIEELFAAMDATPLYLTGPLPTRDELHERR